MATRTVEIEPAAAFAAMVSAMAEAGRYAGRGVWVSGRRAGRRARIVGTEAAHRTALAARVLGGGAPSPVRRSRAGMIVVVAGAGAAGAAAALAARRLVTLARSGDGGDGTPAGGGEADDAPPVDASKVEAETLLGRPEP